MIFLKIFTPLHKKYLEISQFDIFSVLVTAVQRRRDDAMHTMHTCSILIYYRGIGDLFSICILEILGHA